MNNIQIVLLLIVLQQGLCAVSWWVGGWRLGLPKLVSAHWMAGSVAAAVGLALVLERGVWHAFLTQVLANLLILTAFVLVRRGVQVFLRLRVTDAEHAVVLAADALLLFGFFSSTEHSVIAVIGASVPIAWTLLRAAHESYVALRREGSITTARAVATPLTLLGLLFAVRAIAGVLVPSLAAQPLHEANDFNAGVALLFMLVGLMLNLVLALMVVGRLVSRLQHLSERDALTGLLNRRALAPMMLREAGRMRRYGEAYALMMIDIDHFKALNDTHGHAAGDAALVLLARVLREASREVDRIARVGGEEFCILMPHSDLEGARHLATRIHAAVHAAPWESAEQSLTVSIGVAVAQSAEELPTAVQERADRALYRAKNDGRDRVVLDEPAGLMTLRRA